MKMKQDKKDHVEGEDEDIVLIEEVGSKKKKKSIVILKTLTAEEELELVQNYSYYYAMAENEAINLFTKLNHPVIPSMRDLNKVHINYIVNTFKKGRIHERSICFLLLIDYLAISIDNPFYSDYISMHFKSIYPDMIKKILMELKSIIMSWSFSDLNEIKERSQAILRFLQLLLPIFESTSTSDGIDKIIKNIINTVEKKSSTDVDDKTILIEIPDNLTDEHSFTSNQLINPSSKGKQIKRKSSSTIDNFFAKSSTTSTNQSTIKNSSIKSSSSSSLSPTKKPRLDENNETEVCQIFSNQNPVPSTSTASSSTNSNSNTEEKKKVNAFTLMMQQSRLKSQKEKKLAQNKLVISK